MGVFPWGWTGCKGFFLPFVLFLGQPSMSFIPWWFGTCRWAESAFSSDLTSPVQMEVVGDFFKRDLLEYRASLQFSLLLATVTALIFSHEFYQCFPFHQKCLLSLLLIYGGSLSKKGRAFTLMNLDPDFFPVPALSSYDLSFFFACPSPTAKKNPTPSEGLADTAR